MVLMGAHPRPGIATLIVTIVTIVMNRTGGLGMRFFW